MEALRSTSNEPRRPAVVAAPKRKRVRQRVHTPAYASLNGVSNHRELDFSEILNISEDGMAIQTSSPLQTNGVLDLRLEFSETNATIYAAGDVVWSDPWGRTGIHFARLPERGLQLLKEWLFVNAIVGYANYAAERALEPAVEIAPVVSGKRAAATAAVEIPDFPAFPDHTSILVALSAVKREVEAAKPDLDRALQLLAERALAFTRASGAAIALCEGADMICRASAGEHAPSLGARIKKGEGFSGECLRRGQLLRCEDSEFDPLVDAASCRALGIRSIVAVPVRWEQSIIGLIEVFSPKPNGFRASDEVALRQLADFIATAVYQAGTREQLAAPTPIVDDEFPVETAADLVPRMSLSRRILFGAVASTLLLVLYWLLAPWVGSSGVIFSQTVASQPAKPLVKTATPTAENTTDLEGLRKLAEQGDAAAQFAVGARYATGDDVPQDYAEAVRWFNLAAEQGHTVAQATLGAYYWAGRGVSVDLVKAYFWSVLAQAGGDEASKYRVAVLASRMSRDQILAAQRQANDWIRQHQLLSKDSAPAH